MTSPLISSPPVASRWWNRNSGIAICELPQPRRAADAGTVHRPPHGHLLPCDPCAVRGCEAGTAGRMIGLLGLLVTMLEECDG